MELVTEYTPAPGDSVKLVGKENPDNVLYGTYITSQPRMHRSIVQIDGLPKNADGQHVIQDEHWTITPWTRPVTFKPFAVVRLPEGWLSTLDEEAEENGKSATVSRSFKPDNRWAWMDSGSLIELYDTSIATLLNHGAEILFEGVDQ